MLLAFSRLIQTRYTSGSSAEIIYSHVWRKHSTASWTRNYQHSMYMLLVGHPCFYACTCAKDTLFKAP